MCLVFVQEYVQYDTCLYNHYDSILSPSLPSLPLSPPSLQATQMEEVYGHYCKHYNTNKDVIGGSRAELEFYRVRA